MERDEEGRFSPSVGDREVLDAVAANAPAATAEVAEVLEVTRQAADYRLRRLREVGRVESKQIGSALAWSLPSDTTVGTSPAPPAPQGEPFAEGGTEPERVSLDARIRALDAPGSGSRLDERVAATVRVVEHLEREGEATTEELKGLLDDDAVGYADVGSFWSNWIRGAGVLKAIDEVEAPGKGEKVYRYRTDR